MGTNLARKTTALIAAMAATLALVAVFALPQAAYADELAAGELTTQASPDGNTSLANALELKYGQTYTGTFDYADGTKNYEDYWFKFKTSNRDSQYAVQLDSVNSKEIYLYIYDQNGNVFDWYNTIWSRYTSLSGEIVKTDNRVTPTTSKASKNSWYYVRVAHHNASQYDQFRLTFYERRILKAEDVSISPTTFTYDGTAKRPAPTVTYDGKTLVKDVDYSVDYINNVNAGSGTVKVTGIGDDYTGELSKTFAIEPLAVRPTVKLAATSYTYDESYHKPGVTVKYGSEILSPDDYDVSYSGEGYSVGTYTVKVTCKGNYTGTATAKYTVKPIATKLTGLSKLKKGFTATWKPQYDEASGYQVQYSTSSSFKSGNKTATVKSNYTTSKSVKKLASKKKYYVRVRTYMTVDGTKYYSAWSGKRSVKTK